VRGANRRLESSNRWKYAYLENLSVLEVHAPHGATHSVKDFLLHIAAISIGLLLALGLESTAEWLHCVFHAMVNGVSTGT
jgi:hypothetical protein